MSVPPKLKEYVKEKDLKKSRDYSRSRMQFAMVEGWKDFVVTILAWYYRVPAYIWAQTFSLSERLSTDANGQITNYMFDFYQTVFFLLVLEAVKIVFDYPTALIRQFVIEEFFGFNKQTLKEWFKDVVKAFFINWTITLIMLYGLLKIIYQTGDSFVIWVGVFVTIILIFLVILVPLVIMPCFNKFEPIEENILKEDIKNLAADVNYPLNKVEVIDGSKRSSHSNAF